MAPTVTRHPQFDSDQAELQFEKSFGYLSGEIYYEDYEMPTTTNKFMNVTKKGLISYMEDAATISPTTSPNNSTKPGVVVRGEEIGIVLMVLILWVGAIILFFNRWGKIRMLEPYQPKFCEHHNPNCPMADVAPIPIPNNYPIIRTFSKFNLGSESGSPHFSKCNYHGVTTTCAVTEPLLNGSIGGGLGIPGNFTPGGSSPRQNRLRQNSVFVTSPNFSGVSLFGESSTLTKNTSRKTKSAVDLSTLVLSGEFMDNVRRNSKNSITNL